MSSIRLVVSQPKRKIETQLLGGQLPPTMMIGQQLQTMIDPTAAGAVDPMRSRQVLDSVLQRAEETGSDPSGSVYDNLLRDIKEGRGEVRRQR